MTLQALLDNGDQVLIPAPDYPLWTACTSLAGGTPVHYMCDETQGWMPDIADLESKITDRTKAIVVINPNNPTGAVYSREILDADGRISRASISCCCWPTRSTTRSSTTTPSTSPWRRSRRTC